MNYENKYKNALSRASKLRVQNPFDTVGQMVEHIFPEIKESEDERIRKTLIELVRCNERSGYFSLNNIETSSMIAWLEKQGDQKPTDNKERLDMLNFIRKETGCGLAEANNALLKLIKVLKQRPLLIMDKPHKLKIEWEEQQ